METLIVDPRLSERLIAERRARGIDLFDEVWEGMYVMAPAPNNEHQEVELRLARVLLEIVDDAGLGSVRTTINLATDPTDWESDYRIPDITVFLNGSSAVCHDTFWTGPPDFVVEIVSPWDKTRDKFEFYEKIGTRELLVVDRDPWQLELYRLQGSKLTRVADVAPDDSASIQSQVLPIALRLTSGQPRPTISVATIDGQRSWTI
jgi:Uma2 family endonuclease